jgi:hypothetical protein
VNIKGAGTTGASLRESLEGHASLVFTNANIQLVGRTLRPILVVIGTALRVPEIANSPVSWLDANLAFGEGRITLQQFQAAGPAFAGTSQGTVRIARVLTNSPIQNIPVNFALSQSLANRAGFRSSGTNAYVDLGTVAHIRGTLGDPDPKVDYARLALITGQMLGGAAPGAGTNIVGGLLQGLLGGRNVTSTNAPPAPATNSPPATRTNENRSGTILDLLPRNR